MANFVHFSGTLCICRVRFAFSNIFFVHFSHTTALPDSYSSWAYLMMQEARELLVLLARSVTRLVTDRSTERDPTITARRRRYQHSPSRTVKIR